MRNDDRENQSVKIHHRRCVPPKGASIIRRLLGLVQWRTDYSEGGYVEWVDRARCKDEDPELFFPIGNAGPAVAQIEMAKAVCHRCEVRTECLEWAMSTGQEAGVWGGMSEDERRALRRARRRGELSRYALSPTG